MSLKERPMSRQAVAQVAKPAAASTARSAGPRLQSNLQARQALAGLEAREVTGLEACVKRRTGIFTLGIIFLALLVPGAGCGARPGTIADSQSTNGPSLAVHYERVRPPAVAGLFYPGDAAALSKAIDGLLANAPQRSVPRLKALVCPHAGYAFSGQTAAAAYKTPLGLVPISEKAKGLASVAPFALERQCLVQRPPWWRQSPRPAPEEGQG